MPCAQFQTEKPTLCSQPGKTAQVTPREPPLTSRAGPGKSHLGPAHLLSRGQGDLPGSSTVPKTHVSECHGEHSVWHKSKSIEQVHSRAWFLPTPTPDLPGEVTEATSSSPSCREMARAAHHQLCIRTICLEGGKQSRDQ